MCSTTSVVFFGKMLPELLSFSSGKNDLLSRSGLTWGVCGAILALCFSVWSRTTIVVVVEPPTESCKQFLESNETFKQCQFHHKAYVI